MEPAERGQEQHRPNRLWGDACLYERYAEQTLGTVTRFGTQRITCLRGELMMKSFRIGRMTRIALTSAAVLAVSWAALPAQAATGPVSSTPAAGTPQLAATGTTEQVRQLAQCGGTMYAVGIFTMIQRSSTTYTRNNAFSFSAASPFTVTSWNPNVNGTVDSVAFSPDCSEAYLGGEFTSVNGTAVHNIAEVSTSTGGVNIAFAHSANGEVETLAASHGHLLAGGYFTSINGSTNKYFVSLNPTTGRDDGYLELNISGNYGSGATSVHNQQISHGGTLDLAEGTFTSVGGQPRQQIFMLSLGSTSATVTGWTSPEFSQPCVQNEAFYLRAASWSPDDGTVYIATTGFHPLNAPVDTELCDAAAAFSAGQTSQSHLWVNYTGCDSLYSTAADSSLVYVGGHERWADNQHGCNSPGPGSIPAQGMAGLNPATGALFLNSSGTAGFYTRARGLGADDMLITSAGLWIASDNAQNSNQCGGVFGHAGICFLPYTG